VDEDGTDSAGSVMSFAADRLPVVGVAALTMNAAIS
jgi:hypothetical protein